MDATRTTPLRERMRQELQLAGLSERTQKAYLRSVMRKLGAHTRLEAVVAARRAGLLP